MSPKALIQADDRTGLERVSSLFEFDQKECGDLCLVGLDEAGRGPLAGPVVAAAVSFPRDVDLFALVDLDDSKKVTPRRREKLAVTIESAALAVGVGSASPGEIDRLDIEKASFLAMRRALQDSGVLSDLALVDGHRDPGLGVPTQTVVKGDSKSASIAAASILAKTHRDRQMELLVEGEDVWGFAQHKGYPTEYHRRALAVFGASPHHRKTFRPVARYLDVPPPSLRFQTLWKQLDDPKSHSDWESVGGEIQAAAAVLETNEAWLLSRRWDELNKAAREIPSANKRKRGTLYEEWALKYIEDKGYTLLDKNFHARGGEIDLVARDGETLVFFEVKMRRNSEFGSAADAVGPVKQRRLTLAAREFLSRFPDGLDCRFDVIAIEPDESGANRLVHYPGAFEPSFEDLE